MEIRVLVCGPYPGDSREVLEIERKLIELGIPYELAYTSRPGLIIGDDIFHYEEEGWMQGIQEYLQRTGHIRDVSPE